MQTLNGIYRSTDFDSDGQPDGYGFSIKRVNNILATLDHDK